MLCLAANIPVKIPVLKGTMNISALIKELKKEKDEVQRHLAGIDSALLAFARVHMVNKAAQTAEDVRQVTRQDRSCTTCAMGQVQKI